MVLMIDIVMNKTVKQNLCVVMEHPMMNNHKIYGINLIVKLLMKSAYNMRIRYIKRT